ncbi:hypothetical protein L484_024675 [Morus notabilis]|uniref:Uncharacterized protein n=1 Tax=Morus notabilis TaxID=981085 RepID=W9RFA1_9ROSA|nr:hypothetical protein L484_024675 [Morus notabilis]
MQKKLAISSSEHKTRLLHSKDQLGIIMNQSRCKLINQLGPICKTRKDLLCSKSPTEDATCFDEREFDGKDDGTFFMCSSKCSSPISFSPRSQALRFDITNYSVSLLNLDAEDCE